MTVTLVSFNSTSNITETIFTETDIFANKNIFLQRWGIKVRKSWREEFS